MTIFDRIQRDLDQGDFALARQRLISHIKSTGYNAELLARLGHISNEMHDRFNAGRYWLLSSAEGEVVDAAIREFARRCGGNWNQMVQQVPEFGRLGKIADYPTNVQMRIGQYGLEPAILHKPRILRKTSGFKGRFIELLLVGLAFVILSLGITSCILGLNQIRGWLFK